MLIPYLVVTLDVFCRIYLQVARATIREELHETSGVQMLATLSMFARQRLGSVLGSELLLTQLLWVLPNLCPPAPRVHEPKGWSSTTAQ